MDRLHFHSRFHHITFRLNFFMAGCIGLSLLAWFFHTIPPKEGSVITIGIIFLLTTLSCFLLSVVNNVRHVVLVSSGVGVLLILRTIGLRDWLYALLVVAILVSLEYAWSKR